MTDQRYVCNYAVLRFLPYPETGEFVNLGIVVHCAAAGLVTSRLETSKQKRVTDFFPELDETQFRCGRSAIAAELRRVEQLCAAPPLTQRVDREWGRALFLELVRPRESVFRFGEMRTILTGDPASVADELFRRYVERQYAHAKEYQETVLARRYYQALRVYRPERPFLQNREVGTDRYRVRLPICSQETDARGVPSRALKPLNLDRADPSAVTDHGDAWIGRVRRLREIERLPERLVFAVRLARQGRPGEAARDILRRLQEEGVAVGEAEAVEEILRLTAD